MNRPSRASPAAADRSRPRRSGWSCSAPRCCRPTSPRPEPEELLEKIELVSTAYWARTFGLPEILMMKELHQRAPMLLRNTVASSGSAKINGRDVQEHLHHT